MARNPHSHAPKSNGKPSQRSGDCYHCIKGDQLWNERFTKHIWIRSPCVHILLTIYCIHFGAIGAVTYDNTVLVCGVASYSSRMPGLNLSSDYCLFLFMFCPFGMCVLQVLLFPSISQKHASRCIGSSNLPQVWVCVCMVPCERLMSCPCFIPTLHTFFLRKTSDTLQPWPW